MLGVALAVGALGAVEARAATAQLPDPAGDRGPERVDLAGLRIDWDGVLVVAVSYHGAPPPHDLLVTISEASRDEHDPRVDGCDGERDARLPLIANQEEGSLRVGDRSLRAEAEWSGTTVTYRFDDPALRQFVTRAPRDPFTCAAAYGGADVVEGAFEGKVLKLTPATAATGAAAELRRRYGSDFADSPASAVRCPRRMISRSIGDLGAGAVCAFEFRFGERYRLGRALVRLEGGVARVVGLRSRSYDAALRFCGVNNFRRGWRRPPVAGPAIAAFAEGASCTTARRVARRWYRGLATPGFRCDARYRSRTLCFRTGRRRAVVRVEAVTA